MAAYEKAHIDEIASNQWPHWIPVRHHFGIETFGINLWRGRDDGTLIPEHDHGEDGEPELYYTVDGHATFTIAGEEVDAPAGIRTTSKATGSPGPPRYARSGAAGPGGPAGLQNPYGRATHG